MFQNSTNKLQKSVLKTFGSYGRCTIVETKIKFDVLQVDSRRNLQHPSVSSDRRASILSWGQVHISSITLLRADSLWKLIGKIANRVVMDETNVTKFIHRVGCSVVPGYIVQVKRSAILLFVLVQNDGIAQNDSTDTVCVHVCAIKFTLQTWKGTSPYPPYRLHLPVSCVLGTLFGREQLPLLLAWFVTATIDVTLWRVLFITVNPSTLSQTSVRAQAICISAAFILRKIAFPQINSSHLDLAALRCTPTHTLARVSKTRDQRKKLKKHSSPSFLQMHFCTDFSWFH